MVLVSGPHTPPNFSGSTPPGRGRNNGSLGEADQWFDQELRRDLVQLPSKNSQKIFQFLFTSARNLENSTSKSNTSSPAMFFSALLYLVTLVPVGRARHRKIE